MAARRRKPRKEGPPSAVERAHQVFAEAEAKAKAVRENLGMCSECGGTMIFKGRTRHHSCEEGSLAGQRCTCPPGCSDTHYGNGHRECDPECVPCSRMRGQKLAGDSRKR